MDDHRLQGLRRKLVEEIKRKGITDEKVLAAIGGVQRHRFIDDSAFYNMAYVDKAFPIGHGQTISQPYTVACQTQLLGPIAGAKVLEIGTGCGYQTAVLCEVGAKVFSIERHRPLYLDTKRRLEAMGYKATLAFGDGYKGMPAHGPFDRVIVTCAAPLIPQALIDQLRPGGIMVIPVGAGARQTMLKLTRNTDGSCAREEHGLFSFVPMLSEKA